LSAVAEPLRDLLADVEARVDFAEDLGEAALPPSSARASTTRLDQLDALLAGCDLGGARARAHGSRSSAGRTSASRRCSTLVSGETRALVTEVPARRATR
jgi:hypothetical protein